MNGTLGKWIAGDTIGMGMGRRVGDRLITAYISVS
jgi:hypothetical protein